MKKRSAVQKSLRHAKTVEKTEAVVILVLAIALLISIGYNFSLYKSKAALEAEGLQLSKTNYDISNECVTLGEKVQAYMVQQGIECDQKPAVCIEEQLLAAESEPATE